MKPFYVIFLFAMLSWTPALQATTQPTTSGIVSLNGDPVEIRLFPNPTTSYFEISSSVSVQSVEVFNLLGRKMKTFDFAASRFFDISDLPDGMYLVQLIDSKKNIVTTHRLQKR